MRSLPHETRFFSVLAVFVAIATACGVTPRQATSTADAPKAMVDAGASSSIEIIDAGAASPNSHAVAGVEVTTANNDEVDAGPPKATHAPVRLPGKCIDAIANAKQRAKLPPGADLWIEPTRVDLDGDGVEDLITTTGASTVFSGDVYITRGTCGVMVLTWVGSQPIPLDTSTLGFFDLESESICTPGCCATRTVTTYKWNGSSYLKGRPRIVKHQCAFGGTP